MPESNNNRDVEDVLSSVRRLVSGELPQASRRRSMSPQALVLQPTQRVSKAVGGDGRQSLEDRIAELEMQLSSRQDEYEPDGSEDQGQHRPTSVMRMIPSEPEPEAPDEEEEPDVFVLRNEVAEVPDDAAEMSGTPPRRPVRRLSRIELIETSPAGEDLPEDITVAEVDDPARPADDDTPRDSEFDADLASAVAESVNAALGDLAEEIEELESVDDVENAIADAARREIAAQEDATSEDDAPDADDIAEALAPAAALTGRLDGLNAPDTEAPPAPMGKAPDPAPQAGPTTEPPALPDREALRVLVGELIREEFQGELGARITRNVRKLVRREIARALATRDLS